MSGRNDIYITSHHEDENCFWLAVKHFLAWLGHDRLPGFVTAAISVAESAGRVSVHEQPSPAFVDERDVFTVVSANLWHDWPRYKNLDKRLEAFASLVESEHADLILLQELVRKPSLKADEWLAERLNMAHVYSRVNGSEKIGFEEGLGVFSRFPLKQIPYLRQLGRTCNPFVRRLALGVEVDTPFGAMMAFSTHLGLFRKQNARQLGELHEWIDKITSGRSAIIAGDFNSPEHTRQIKYIRDYWQDTFREIHEHGHASTHEIRWPWGGAILSRRLDYIFLQPGEPAWRVVDVQHVDAADGPHSDHRAVLARFMPGQAVM